MRASVPRKKMMLVAVEVSLRKPLAHAWKTLDLYRTFTRTKNTLARADAIKLFIPRGLMDFYGAAPGVGS
jgi:hypothetical protein